MPYIKSQTSRTNGAKSHGPTSAPGRARSSQNALKHGLTSETLLLPSENPDEFQALLATYLSQLHPDGPIELDLVHEIVAAKWRLDRIALIETQLLSDAIADAEHRAPRHLTPTAALAAGFERLANRNSLTVLHRMESRLSRAYSRALRNLLQLQKLRHPPAEAVIPIPDPAPAPAKTKTCRNEPTDLAPPDYLNAPAAPTNQPTADTIPSRSP